MTKPTEMPSEVRTLLFGAAVLLGITAAGGNIGHVFDAVRHAGQGERMAGVIALMPDVLLLLCIFKLRYEHRSRLGWLGLAYSLAFIIWASTVTASAHLGVGTAEPPTRRAVGLSPLGFAIIAAGLIESKPRAPEQTPGKSNASRRGQGPARPTTAVATSTPRSKSEPDSVAPSQTPAPVSPRPAAGTAGPESPPPGRPLHSVPDDEQPDELLPEAKKAAEAIRQRGEQVTKRSLMAQLEVDGINIGDRRALKLLKEVA
jgi:hypothetical protein